jgi:hypothetical protein
MRKIELTMPQFLAVCFITILVSMNINSYMQIRALDNIAKSINDSKQEQVVMTYEDKSELEITVTYEKQDDGDMIYDFGDVSDEYYFYIIINEEQGIYEYYFPAMHIDWPIECDSLEELQSVVMCHIEQAYPNARFVMRSN